MKIGSLVELVDDKWIKDRSLEPTRRPVKGKIYTVRDISTNDGRVFIRLEEIVNPKLNYSDVFGELRFNITRFRELQPPMTISVESVLEMEVIES